MIEAVADRFEGAFRRRRRSDELKARVVAGALEPGESISAIARRLDIHPSQLSKTMITFLRKWLRIDWKRLGAEE